jgi:hypothetical protein
MHVSIDHADASSVAASARADELVNLDEALQRLATVDERLTRVIELRFFGAKAWLYQELRDVQ